MNPHSDLVAHQSLLRFIAHGTPAPQGSKKHIGAGRMIETNKNLPAWRQALVAAATTAQKAQKTKYRPLPAGPPDLDKLARAVGDALTQSGTLTDDARITGWITHKYWATKANPPGARIDILTTEGDPK